MSPESTLRENPLSFPLLLNLQPGAGSVLAQNGGDLALHESPGHLTVRQRTLLAARTVNLKTNKSGERSVTKRIARRRVRKKFGTRYARNTHLRAGALSLYAVPTAREAKLVMGHAGTLDEVRVLEALLAERALQSRLRDWLSAGGLSDRAF